MNLQTWRLKEFEMCDLYGPDTLGFHMAQNYGEKIIIYDSVNSLKNQTSYYTYNTINNIWTNYKIQGDLKRELYTGVYRKNTERIYFFGGYLYDAEKE